MNRLILLLLLATAVSGAQETVKFKQYEMWDPALDCRALTMLVPEGWRVDGGVEWRTQFGNMAVSHFIVYDPESGAYVRIYPRDVFCDGNGLGQYFRYGDNYLGREFRPPIADPAQFVSQILLPRYRPEIGAQILSSRPSDKIAELVYSGYNLPNQKTQTRAGVVRIGYRSQGATFEEDIYLGLAANSYPTTRDTYITNWEPGYLIAYGAPSGQLDRLTPLLQVISTSMRVDPYWETCLNFAKEQFVINMRQGITAAANLGAMIHKMGDDYRRSSMAGYWARQEARSKSSHEFANMLKGVNDFYDPVRQRPVALPHGYEHYWINGTGDYIFSHDPLYDPNLESTQTWTQMRPGGY